ncbi:hypothetical protein LTS18_002720, partial [Coniosporium uncinatum]
ICASAPALRPLILRLFPRSAGLSHDTDASQPPTDETSQPSSKSRSLSHVPILRTLPFGQPAKDRRHSNLPPQTSSVDSGNETFHHRTVDLDDLETGTLGRRVWIISDSQTQRRKRRRPSRSKGPELEKTTADKSMHIVTTRTFSMVEGLTTDTARTLFAPPQRLSTFLKTSSLDNSPRLPTAEEEDEGREPAISEERPLHLQEASIKKQKRFSKLISRETVGFGTATTISAANTKTNTTATHTHKMPSTAPTPPPLPSSPSPARVRLRPASPSSPPQIADDVLVMASDGALRGVHRFLSTEAPSSEHLLWSHALATLFPARSVKSRGSSSEITRRSSVSGSQV